MRAFLLCGAAQVCTLHFLHHRPVQRTERRGGRERITLSRGLHMRKTLLMGLSALAMTSAFAAPAAAAELGSGFNVNGGAAVVTDYRFRGISQSFKNFAIQGNVSLSHE